MSSSVGLVSVSPSANGVQSTKSFGAALAAKPIAVDPVSEGGEVNASPSRYSGRVSSSAVSVSPTPISIKPSSRPAVVSSPVSTASNEINAKSVSPEAVDDRSHSAPETGVRQSASVDQQRVERESQQMLSQLRARDREVRAHEQAHAIAGGVHAGAPKYQFQQGPDGVNYAVAGSVDVDLSPVAGDPAATIEKMEKVKAAALAPAQPSSQDLKIAAQAGQLAAQARAELVQQDAATNQGTALSSTERAAVLTEDAEAFDDGGFPGEAAEKGLGTVSEDEEAQEKKTTQEEDEKNAEASFENIKPEGKVVKQYLAVYEGIAQISDVLVAAQVESEKTSLFLNDLVGITA